jgi:uncharacterized protein RhaS with RHS repeats
MTTPLGFAGQYTDSESGLQYFRARYHDPVTAQFLSRDPMDAATRSPSGHPEGAGSEITFTACVADNGDVMLQEHASGPDTFIGAIFRALDIPHAEWTELGQNLRSYLQSR